MNRAFSAGDVLGGCLLGRRFRLPQAGMTDAVGVKRQKAEIGKAESRN